MNRRLTEAQISVLKFHTLITGRLETVPHGVYRSLIIRGYLRPHKLGYEITPEGYQHPDINLDDCASWGC